MSYAGRNILQRFERAAIIRRRATSVSFALLWLAVQPALAQNKPAPKDDDLDVTMQIITDPDAKRPDEVVRHIPLPPPKPAATTEKNNDKDVADKGREPASEAKELAREATERAKERAKEAKEQREQASRSRADERRRDPDPPKPPPPRGRP